MAGAPGNPATSARRTETGVRLAVRLTPRAGRNAIRGTAERADGGVALKAAVTAVPEGGKANAALVALLAKALKVPKGAIGIAQGTTDRNKLLDIAGDTDALMAAIGRLENDTEGEGQR